MKNAIKAIAIATLLSEAAKKEILQFDISGEGNDRNAMIELERYGLMQSIGRGDALTELGEEVLAQVRSLTNIKVEVL